MKEDEKKKKLLGFVKTQQDFVKTLPNEMSKLLTNY